MTEFKSSIGRAGCHIENVGELVQTFEADYVTEDGKVKISGEQTLALLGQLFGKFQETMLECEGVEVEVEFGDSATANLLETVVKFILQFTPPVKPEDTQDVEA